MMLISWVVPAVAAEFLGAAPVAAEEAGTLSFIRTYVQDYATIDFAGGSVTGGSLDGWSPSSKALAIAASRRLNGWCEFSARLLSQRLQVPAAALPITVIARSPVGL